MINCLPLPEPGYEPAMLYRVGKADGIGGGFPFISFPLPCVAELFLLLKVSILLLAFRKRRLLGVRFVMSATTSSCEGYRPSELEPDHCSSGCCGTDNMLSCCPEL